MATNHSTRIVSRLYMEILVSKLLEKTNKQTNIIMSGFGMKEPGATRFAGKISFNSHVRQAEDQTV